jgi:hypothetical protein
MKHILSKSIIAGIALFVGLIQAGFARDYHVEVIIFERPASSDPDQEVWNFSPQNLAQDLQKFETLAAKASETEFNSTLEFLAGAEASMRESGLRILRTASWIQPSAVYQNAPLVSMGAENSTLPGAYIRVYKTSLIFADVDLQLNPFPVQEFDQNNGSATALATPTSADSNSQELSTDPELETATAAGVSAAEINYPARFFLSERRRLKFKEVHYFDHPKFGAILGVWPSE